MQSTVSTNFLGHGRPVVVLCGILLGLCLVVTGCDGGGSSPVNPMGDREVSFSFTTTVRAFTMSGILVAPFQIEVGEKVDVTVSYGLDSGTPSCHSDESFSRCSYREPPGALVTISSRFHTWSAPIEQLSLFEAPGVGARFDMNSSSISGTFPGQLGTGNIVITLLDDQTPVEMIRGTDLQVVDADAATRAGVSIASRSADGQKRWGIVLELPQAPTAPGFWETD